MKAYASMTGTRRNLDALRAAGWGVVLTPYHIRSPRGLPYMIDNGRYTMWQIELAIARGDLPTAAPDSRYDREELTLEESFDIAFTRLLDLYGPGADQIVIPDVPGDGTRSLDLSLYWLEYLVEVGPPLLFPVQDGMSAADVMPYLGTRPFDVTKHGERLQGLQRLVTQTIGIFLGGTTEWKLATMGYWGELARSLHVPYHVGRVNTQQRMRAALEAGATSIDGSSASRYETTLRDLEDARQGLKWVTRGLKRNQLQMF